MIRKTYLAGGRGWLDIPAAASLERTDLHLGDLLPVDSAGREESAQRKRHDAYVKYLHGGPAAPIAVHPDCSSHVQGLAIDTSYRGEFLDRRGWKLLPYREGREPEPHHRVYLIRFDEFLPTLRIGTLMHRASTGLAVSSVQARLRITVTGRFDRPTETAVKAFQHACGLPVTGVVDRPTHLRLGA